MEQLELTKFQAVQKVFPDTNSTEMMKYFKEDKEGFNDLAQMAAASLGATLKVLSV